jgi:hypothetical protein
MIKKGVYICPFLYLYGIVFCKKSTTMTGTFPDKNQRELFRPRQRGTATSAASPPTLTTLTTLTTINNHEKVIIITDYSRFSSQGKEGGDTGICCPKQ